MSTTTPAVYVGTYHKYNCGSIAGQWFDLTDFDSAEDFYAACSTLHADEDDAEFMFQDWEGIPTRFASESQVSWAFIDAYKQAESEGQAAAFFAWSEYSGECDYDKFDEAFRGKPTVKKPMHASLWRIVACLVRFPSPCAIILILKPTPAICLPADWFLLMAMYFLPDLATGRGNPAIRRPYETQPRNPRHYPPI